jgi:hypothetical protein
MPLIGTYRRLAHLCDALCVTALERGHPSGALGGTWVSAADLATLPAASPSRR